MEGQLWHCPVDETRDGITSGPCRRCGCSAEFDAFGDRICWCDSCKYRGCEFRTREGSFLPGERVLFVHITRLRNPEELPLGGLTLPELRTACERFGPVDKIKCFCHACPLKHAEALVYFTSDVSAFAALQSMHGRFLFEGECNLVEAQYSKRAKPLVAEPCRLLRLHIRKLANPTVLPLGGLGINIVREACAKYGILNRIAICRPRRQAHVLDHVDVLVEFASSTSAHALWSCDDGASLTGDEFNCTWVQFATRFTDLKVKSGDEYACDFEALVHGADALKSVHEPHASKDSAALQRCSQALVADRVQLAIARLRALDPSQRPQSSRALKAWAERSARCRHRIRVAIVDPVEVLTLLVGSGLEMMPDIVELAANALKDHRPAESDRVSLRNMPRDRERIERAARIVKIQGMTGEKLAWWATEQAYVEMSVATSDVLAGLIANVVVQESQQPTDCVSEDRISYNLPELPSALNESVEHQKDIQTDIIVENVDTAHESFDSLALDELILRGIYSYGFEKPSWIQQWGVKPIIYGQHSILKAPSGSGKTAAYAIGLLQRIDWRVNQCQALILVPGRELAVQIQKVILALGDYCKVRCHTCIGGTSVRGDIDHLKDGQHVIVGACGRVYDMISKRHLKVDNIRLLIVDEADNMLSSKNIGSIRDIMKCLPPKVQICLCSSTMQAHTVNQLKNCMPHPARILCPDSSIVPRGLKHYYVALANEEEKRDTIVDLLLQVTYTQLIVFFGSRRKVDYMADYVSQRDITVSSLHAELDQKERDLVMREFRNGSTRILLTTDLLSRGLDIQQTNLIINYDMPEKPELYVHQVGRSGRFGRSAAAISLVTGDAMEALRPIEVDFSVQFEELPCDLASLLEA